MSTAVTSATSSYHPGSAAAAPRERLQSLDIVRGVVMLLMAIDHVRIYAGVPAGGPTFGVFFTRWVTHFAAPAFVFLAGTGAFLNGRKLGDRRALARYLVTRGVLLVALELTVLRFCWTFNTDVAHYNIAGVIWMLGWCMVLMAGLIWLPDVAIGAIGLALVFGQSAFGALAGKDPNWLMRFLHAGGGVQVGAHGPPIDILYVIVPWIGVMAAGYAFGRILTRDADDRRQLCLRIGLTMTAAFIVVACAQAFTTPPGPDSPPILFRVLGQRKYPASPLFLLMTLGPTIALLPLAERMRGRVADVLSTYGRVPLFYYLLHIPAIHLAAIVVSFVREGSVNPWLFGNHPMEPPPVPPGYRWSLGLLYLVWAVVVAALYVPCARFAALKARRRDTWLRYL